MEALFHFEIIFHEDEAVCLPEECDCNVHSSGNGGDAHVSGKTISERKCTDFRSVLRCWNNADRARYLSSGKGKYGIDIFGDAIDMARENAALAGEKINFIHRDYFDFKHDYKFDEIVTNMPVKGKKAKEDMDAFYARFLKSLRVCWLRMESLSCIPMR